MAFLDTYFAGSWTDYLTYFNGLDRYYYHYVLKYIPRPVAVINSGGEGETDWVDSDGDGVADGWTINEVVGDAFGEIVTGIGFNGNAQRVEVIPTEPINQITITRNVEELDILETYTIRFRYKCSSAGIGVIIGSLNVFIPYVSGDVYEYVSSDFTITSDTELLTFYITNATGQDYIEIDTIELLKPDETLILKVNPGGWEKLNIKFDRSKKYNSILRSYAGSLIYPQTEECGGTFINEKYVIDELNTLIVQEIYERNDQTNDFDLIYPGELDFKPGRYFNNITDKTVEIGVRDSSKTAKMVERDEIEYDLFSNVSHDNIYMQPFTSSPKSVSLPGIDILLFLNYTGLFNVSYNYLHDSPSHTIIQFLNPITIISNELQERFKANDEDNKFYENTSDSTTYLRIDSFLKDEFNIKLTRIKIHGTGYGYVYLTALLVVYDSEGLPYSTKEIYNITEDYNVATDPFYTSLINNVALDFSLLLDIHIVPPGGYIAIQTSITVISNAYNIYIYQYDPFELTGYEIFPSIGTTTAKGFLLNEAFTKELQLITSESDTSKIFRSSLLGRIDSEFTSYGSNGKWSELFITGGWQLRKFEEKGLLASVEDTFNATNAITPVGLGYDRINDIFFLEDISEFYKDDYFMFNLEGVTDLVLEPDGDAYFNEIKGGYPQIENEEINGAKEFNAPLEYTFNKPLKNTYDVQCTFNGSSITIELTRRKQWVNYNSEDTKGDELRFIIYTKNLIAVQGGDIVTNPSGIVNIDQYYNLDITGRENIIRHGKVINTINRKAKQPLRFSSLKKGVNISYTNSTGAEVSEKDSVQPSELIGDLIIPVTYNFKHPVNQSILTTMNTDPHGFITFTYGDNSETIYAKIKTLDIEAYPEVAEWTVNGTLIISGLNFNFEDGNNFIFEELNNFIFE